MMEIEIRALLLGDAEVTGHVGDRVNFGSNPQGAGRPAIVLNVIDDVGHHTLEGPAKLFAARLQVDCYADHYDAAKYLSRSVRAVLDGYRAGLIQAVFLVSAQDGREGGTDEADRPFRVSLDFMVHYSTN